MINIDKYHINRIDELIEETDRLRTRVKMYELKVGKLRREIGEYIDKYEKGGNRQIKKITNEHDCPIRVNK